MVKPEMWNYPINPLGTDKQKVSPGDLLLNFLIPGGYTVHFYVVPFLQFSRYLILPERPRVSKIGVYLLLPLRQKCFDIF